MFGGKALEVDQNNNSNQLDMPQMLNSQQNSTEQKNVRLAIPNQGVVAVTPSEAGTFVKRGDRMRELTTDNDSNGLTRQNLNGAREPNF